MTLNTPTHTPSEENVSPGSMSITRHRLGHVTAFRAYIDYICNNINHFSIASIGLRNNTEYEGTCNVGLGRYTRETTFLLRFQGL